MPKFFSKIFIDGGEPAETRQANEILKKSLGRPLDGQTTNPTLIAKNLINNKQKTINNSLKDTTSEVISEARKHLEGDRMGSFQVEEAAKLTPDLALAEYKRIVIQMSQVIPQGSISIQVFANLETKAEEMIVQARERHKWIPNSSVKLPCTTEGLKAAEIVCQEFPINITLVFSQSQAAAVYEATKKAKYPVFISPFVGRLDDKGENGMEVVANILKMYKSGDGHVEVLTASVRNLDHIFYALQLKSNIITIPFKVFQEWADFGFPESLKTTSDGGPARGGDSSGVKKSGVRKYIYPSDNLKPIPYRADIILGRPWQSYDLHHELTDRGVASFWNDWNGLFF